MATPVRDTDEPESGTGTGSQIDGLPARHARILMAYLETPNAAAVARALKTNERHVRRVVKQHEDRLQDLRHERDREARERAHARQAKTQDWADAALPETLSQLDAFATSENEGLRFRALKMKLDLALGMPLPPYPTGSARGLEHLERRLARRVADLEAGIAEEETADD